MEKVQRPGAPGGLDHYNFIERTDRRNLKTQLTSLVSLAQQIAKRDLSKRRKKLEKLLTTEDKMFEQEFANSAKTRLQLEIKKPTTTAAEDARKLAEFRKTKRMQQYMTTCYEIRQAYREKDRQEYKISLEEQMLENERKVARQRELDRYWLKVQDINLRRDDERTRHEACMKEWRKDQVSYVLKLQLEEREAKLEIERKEKAAEVERIHNLLRELEMEELNRSQSEEVQRALQYRQELVGIIEAKRKVKDEEKKQEVRERCQLEEDVRREEEEERQRIALAKKEHKKALLDFIAYIQRMRKLEADMEQRLDDRAASLYRMDICTKNNIAEVKRLKAEKAQECYADLRKQICEQMERQRRDEIERREDKIIENRFSRDDEPRSALLARRQQNRRELDIQCEEIRKWREQEEKKHEKHLLRAFDDPEICCQLADQYIRDNLDYLEPHVNWDILLDPCQKYTPKGEGKKLTLPVDEKKSQRHRPKEPLLPVMTCAPIKPTGPCSKIAGDACKKKSTQDNKTCVNKCIVPCGCAKRWKIPC